MISLEQIMQAQELIDPYIIKDNTRFSKKISKLLNSKVFFKLESLQETGSFKIRGAVNAVLMLSEEQRQMGVIAASGGNHAQGVAWACQDNHITCTIIFPANAPIAKIKATQDLGAITILHGTCFDEASDYARELSEKEGAILLDAGENEHVIAGYGTIGLELVKDIEGLDNVIVPVGGGGLISGISVAIKRINPKIKIYGVETSALNALAFALKKQHPVLVAPNMTIADGINVREIGETAFGIIQNYVDAVVSVSEEEIAAAMLYMLEKEKQVAEGAGAVGIAALMNNKIRIKPNQKTVVIISGGNVDVTLLGDVIEHGLMAMHRRICFGVVLSNQLGALENMLSEIDANIETMAQTRSSSRIVVNHQIVDLVIDVVDRAQGDAIKNKLKIKGYQLIDDD